MSGQVSVWSIWLHGEAFGWMAREECIMKGVTCKYAVYFLLDCSESETHKKAPETIAGTTVNEAWIK